MIIINDNRLCFEKSRVDSICQVYEKQLLYDLIKMVLDLKNMINWAELRKKKVSSLILDGKRDNNFLFLFVTFLQNFQLEINGVNH